MPLARIITEVADDCLELTMQLRARGFQVETVAPGVVSSTPADLEVRLEECAPEDVVSHMAQNSAGDDLWVFVAPGALDSNSVPIRNTPVSIDPVMPRIGLGKGDAKRFAIERLMERTVTVSPLTVAGQDMTIGAKGGQSREIVVDLARIPAAPIATKAGAEEEKAFHRVLRFESMSLSYI